MSASDLVPRVVLFVTDLERENAALKLQLQGQEDERLLVQITGPKRTPIYYEGSLKNGYSLHSGNNNALLGIHLEGDVFLPLSVFISLEIWLSGTFVEKFQEHVLDRLTGSYGFSPDDPADNNESRMGMGNMCFSRL